MQLWTLGLDLQLIAFTILPWSALDLVDLDIALPIWGARMLVEQLYQGYVLAPLRTWERAGDAASDAELLAADHCAQHFVVRFIRLYSVLLVGSLLLCAVLARLGIPHAVPFGNVELVVGVMFAFATIVTAAVWRALLDARLTDTQARLWAVLEARKLEPERPRSSLFGPVIILSVTVVFGCLVGMFGFAYYFHVQGLREAEVQTQLRVAELTAMELSVGRSQSNEDAELLSTDELEPWLLDELAPLAPGESLAKHDPRRDLAYALAPVGDGRWVFAHHPPEERLLFFIVFATIILVGAIPLLASGFWSNTRRLAGPIQRFSAAAQRFVADGELRSLERIIPSRHDELGELAQNFNAMLDRLLELADAAQGVASGDLRVDISHPGELHQAFRSLLARLRETVTQLRESAQEVASAASSIDALTREQDGSAKRQSVHVEELRAAVLSLVGSAESIAGATRGVLSNAEQTVTTTDEMAEKITALRSETASIEALMGQIREIADRSDLLALNGSLEATRAGEAGRGFALVATEMRRLAERVTGTVTDVRGRVESIEAAGAGTMATMHSSRELAQLTAQAASAISQETTRQSGDSARVSRSVEELGRMLAQTSELVADTRSAAAGLRAYAARLEQLTTSFTLAHDEHDEHRDPSAPPR